VVYRSTEYKSHRLVRRIVGEETRGRRRLSRDDPLRALELYEVELRNLLAVQIRTREVVQRLQPQFPEQTADLLKLIAKCQPERLINSVASLRAAIEAED
jgi:hypothetical protein